MALNPTGLSSAAMAPEEEDKEEKKKNKKKKQASGAGQGAAAGAATGAVAGPVGALVGAGIGAAAGAAEANQAEKKTGPRPPRRRLARGLRQFEETKQKRERALATLSQAVFDWAASIR